MPEIPRAARRRCAPCCSKASIPTRLRCCPRQASRWTLLDTALDEDELAERLPGVALLGIRSKTEVTERVLDAADSLAGDRRVLHRHQPDRPRRGLAPRDRGLQRAVLQHPQRRRARPRRDHRADPAADGQKRRDARGGLGQVRRGSHEFRGRRLGIVGYGNIGSQLSVLAENLGMTVFFYDTADKLALGNARRCASLDELLERPTSSPCMSTDGRQRRVFRRQRVRADASRKPVPEPVTRVRRRPSRRCASTSRVGRLAGAAIDVFPEEPSAPRRGVRLSAARPGKRHPDPARRRLDRGSAAGHRPVRRRQVARLPRSAGHDAFRQPAAGDAAAHRRAASGCSSLHRNMPGVLATVNGLMAEHGMNIEGQLLATRGDSATSSPTSAATTAPGAAWSSLRALPVARSGCGCCDDADSGRRSPTAWQTTCVPSWVQPRADRPGADASYETDWTGRFSGAPAAVVVRPASTAEVAGVVKRVRRGPMRRRRAGRQHRARRWRRARRRRGAAQPHPAHRTRAGGPGGRLR